MNITNYEYYRLTDRRTEGRTEVVGYVMRPPGGSDGRSRNIAMNDAAVVSVAR